MAGESRDERKRKLQAMARDLLGPTLPGGEGGADGLGPGDLTIPEPRSGEAEIPRGDGETAIEEGRSFGRYRLLAELGRGGMGVVWKAFDTELNREVALKQILAQAGSDPGLLERFQREARAAARLSHPGIVTVHDVGVHEGQHFFTADFVEGTSLESLMGRPMRAKKAVALVRAVAEALGYAHERGIVHRDVKPANILLDAEGRPRLTDFGLAKDVRKAGDAGLTLPGVLMGTPRYMSPEQAEGRSDDIGPASDQFSLGAILYQLLTGHAPFEGDTLPTLLCAICEQDPAPPTQFDDRIHPDLERICLKALRKDPAKRYRSMRDLVSDLSRYLEGEPLRASRTSSAHRAVRPRRRVPIPFLWGGISAGAAALLLGAWAIGGGGGRDPGGRETGEGEREAARLDDGRPEADASRAPALVASARELALEAARLRYDETADPENVTRLADEARAATSEALALDPQVPSGGYLEGLAWELAGWPDRAEAAYREAIRLAPADGNARLALAKLLAGRVYVVFHTEVKRESTEPEAARGRELAQEARRHLSAALAGGAGLEEGSIERAVARAYEACLSEDLGGARRIVAEEVARFGDRAGVEDLHWVDGVAADGQADKAEAFGKAAKIRPNFPLALVCRALARCEQNQAGAAISDCSQAIHYDPRSADAYGLRAKVRYSQREFAAAERDFDAVVRLRPEDAGAYNNRGALRYAMERNDAAIEDYEKAVELDPDFGLAYLNCGIARRARGDLARAVRDFDAAIRLGPVTGTWYYERATTHHAMGDFDRAIGDFTEAIRLSPGNLEAYNDRGSSYKSKGELGRALPDFDEALRIDPSYLPALANRGDARFVTGDMDGALQDIEKALSLAPADWPYRRAFEDLRARARQARSGG